MKPHKLTTRSYVFDIDGIGDRTAPGPLPSYLAYEAAIGGSSLGSKLGAGTQQTELG